MFRPPTTRVYGSITDEVMNGNFSNKDQTMCNTTRPRPKPGKSSEIEVTATAEASKEPDRAVLNIIVSSRKDVAAEAKNSVARRTDYIIQTLHTFQIKKGDVSRTDSLQKKDGIFEMLTEVSVTFNDTGKCLAVTNLLVEKLDDSVIIQQPVFYHTPHSIEVLRNQVCLQAVSNCQKKAINIGGVLGQVVGQPTRVVEEYSKEWEGASVSADLLAIDGLPKPSTMQQQILNRTVHIKVKMKINFNMKSKEESKVVPR